MNSRAVGTLVVLFASELSGGFLSPLKGQARAESSVASPATPVHTVARRMREALRAPDRPGVWSEIARALPELALEGSADLEGTMEAARIAEDLTALENRASPASGASASNGSRNGEASAGEVRFPQEAGLPFPRPSDILVILTGIVVLGVLLKTSGGMTPWQRRSVRRPDTGDAGGGHSAGEIRHLASVGLTVREIARRTGMAQDAIHVLMEVRR
ncbi:MAG: hypothetical protein ACE5GJ_12040 [Gemmatimonadota bacterium]